MLRLLNHGAHLVGEALLGLAGVGALLGCVLAWRLAQGPIDVTGLVAREHGLLHAKGAHVTVGRAALEWEGFAAARQPGGAPLEVVVWDATVADEAGRVHLMLRQARVALSVPQLLLGRVAPRSVVVDGARILVARDAASDFGSDLGRSDLGGGGLGGGGGARAVTQPAIPPWLRALRHVEVHDSVLTLRGFLPKGELQAGHLGLTLTRLGTGALQGSGGVVLEAGGVSSAIRAEVKPGAGGTMITASAEAISPASLQGLAPGLGLAALDAPVGMRLEAALGAALQPVSARLVVQAGPGTVRVGRGTTTVSGIDADVAWRPGEVRLESCRLAFAPVAGAGAPPPVVTGWAGATLSGGHVHARFGVDIASAALGDLGRYWPEGTGGGSRAWLVENVTAGRAQDAHVQGALDGGTDPGSWELTALSGTMAADDVAISWLRPISGLEHAHARLRIEGPDALTVTMDKGGQNGLALVAGSSIRITGLSKAHQFGDIDVGMTGALPDALGLLNHPRLRLLSRGGLDVAGAAGSFSARMTLHVPLEDRVTMDDIPISASASLHDIHLGRVAAGHDLDNGEIALKVTGDGLSATGTAAVAGIPADLSVAMDFRDGPPGQVLQHVTAKGTASLAQLRGAGLPVAAAGVLTGGVVGLRVDYAGRRDDQAALQVDADLAGASVATPLGWAKDIGAASSIGGRVSLDHGHLAGVENLHAEGPGLRVSSRAEIVGGARILNLDRVALGRTRAHGSVVFAAASPVVVSLSGSLLDLSPELAPGSGKPAGADARGAEEKTGQEKAGLEKAGQEKAGQAWAAKMDFDQVQLSKGEILAPFHLDAASDGLRILHAQVRAGAQSEIVASVTPVAGGRAVRIASVDAGATLRALGVADNLVGGRLVLDGAFDDTKSGSPLTGTATLKEFNLRSAPAIGRLLQAMTLYGVADILRGPGLHFSKLVAPFRWGNRVLTLTSARAFSASLGITAQGDIDLRRRVADVTGTVVPAYFFNKLLGDLPLVGPIFSPEKGGGVFAARYSVRGALGDPSVGVNPLSALTPGFLREGFGLLGGKK